MDLLLTFGILIGVISVGWCLVLVVIHLVDDFFESRQMRKGLSDKEIESNLRPTSTTTIKRTPKNPV